MKHLNTVSRHMRLCRQAGVAALSRNFPDNRFTTITSVTLTEEPDAVDALAQRFESFGESHSLFRVAAGRLGQAGRG